MNKRLAITWLCSVAVLFLLVVADILAGPLNIGIADIFRALFSPSGDNADAIVLQLRLPRLVTAVVAGAALAISGAQMQAIFRNPLADPHILGVSAGAGTGAAAVMLICGAAGIAGFRSGTGSGSRSGCRVYIIDNHGGLNAGAQCFSSPDYRSDAGIHHERGDFHNAVSGG